MSDAAIPPRSRAERFFPAIVLTIVSVLGVLVSLGILEPPRQRAPPRVIDIQAFQFGFEPNRVVVEAGEAVLFRAISIDVTHGFYIDGTDIKENLEPFQPKDIGPITFDKPGKLKIRCAHFCGPLHPFMVADLVVESRVVPFYPLLLVFALLLALAMFGYLWKVSPTDSLLGVSFNSSIDVFRIPFVGPLIH